MSFFLEDEQYCKIKELFDEQLLSKDFEHKIKQSIRVLHFQYLWGACKEAQQYLLKHPHTTVSTLFDFIMNLYNKKRKIHQAKFLLLHCFENALRSTLAVGIAKLYNTQSDDWFSRIESLNSQKAEKLKNIIERRLKQSRKSLNDIKNSFELFDFFSLIDLQNILETYWDEFAHLFKDEKCYKCQVLPIYGTKNHLLTKINQIRCARNEIFHNKPTKIRFQKDLEILLLRLGYNLYEAINLGDI